MMEWSPSVSELIDSGIQIRWTEAVALVEAVGRVIPGDAEVDPAAVRLCPDGTVRVTDVVAPVLAGAESRRSSSATERPGIRALAALLQRLLPPPGVNVEPKVPAGLRYAVLRASGSAAAPPYASTAEFVEALARFDRGDPVESRKRLCARWAASRVTQTRARVRASSHSQTPPSTSSQTPPSTRAASDWDAWPLQPAAQPDADPTGELWLHPPVGQAITPVSARDQRAGPLLTTAAAVSVLFASAVVAVAVILGADAARYSALIDAIRPPLEWLHRVAGAIQ